MGDIFFAIRMLVVTIVIAVLMQIKIGDMTLETHAHSWVQSSSAVESLREIAQGGVRMIRVGYKTVVNLIDAKVGAGFNRDQMAGSRSLSLGLERSAAFEKEQEAKRRAEAATAQD